MEKIYKLMQDSRQYAWNFLNIISMIGSGVTIEWRMPPGVTTADECFMWVELAVGFLQAARRPETAELLRTTENSYKYLPCLGGLKQFIDERGRLPGFSQYYLNMVFRLAGCFDIDWPTKVSS